MNKTILIVSHEATLTGAPILLLNLAKCLRRNTSYNLVILLKRDGPLRKQFEEIAPVLVYEQNKQYPRLLRLLRRHDRVGAYLAWRCQRALRAYTIDLIFSNTISNGKFIDSLFLNKLPIVTYVHELAFNTQMQQLVNGDIAQVLAHSTLFLAGSQAVCTHLLSMGVQPERVEVIPSSVPVTELSMQLAGLDTVAERAALQLPSDSQLVVAVGTANWRKGSDWFTQLAGALTHQHPRAHFAWVGVSPGTLEHMQMSYDIAHYKLTQRFHMVPVTPEYLKYIALADVFVLPSREDPFPLVVLEAAVAAKPTVCFADAGGTPEFVQKGCGKIVPYGDVPALAEAVGSLLAHPEHAQVMGATARKQVEREHNVEDAAARIEVLVSKLIKAEA